MLKNILDYFGGKTIVPGERSFLLEEDVRIVPDRTVTAPAPKARLVEGKARTMHKHYVSKPALS